MHRPTAAVGGSRSGIAISAILAIVLATFVAVLAPAEPANAARASDFDAGYLISDRIFYDDDAMGVDAVQRFLDARVPTCAATTGPACLKDYRTDTWTRPAEDGRCVQYSGRSSETAAQVIVRVGQACGINPRVLIVLLEKEQGLVSDTSPSTRQYRSATGYGCPDTADCDAAFYGFFNQVYMAALQFKRYAAAPEGRAYEAGRVNQILYHPNAACGTKSVTIRNQATAGLYLYTPYTPNAEALKNLYGRGDDCSSYGNRNFWRIFTDWFGSPTAGSSPTGALESVRSGFRQVQVGGWAEDADTSDPIRVHVYVDGRGRAATYADQPEDGSTRSSGFDVTITDLDPGSHRVCAYGINVGPGSTKLLGCRDFSIRSGSPFGVIDKVVGAPGAIEFRGWVIDPDTDGPVRVHAYVDGRGRLAVTADEVKEGLDDVFPGYGDEHKYSGRIENVGPGSHRVCFYGINQGSGSTRIFACRTVEMPSGSPVGEILHAEATGIGTVEVSGWAVDPDVVDPVRVHLYADGSGAASLWADEEVEDPSVLPEGYGTAHGFTRTLTGLGPDDHRICAYAIDVGAGSNRQLGCVTVEMPSGSPRGVIDAVEATGTAGELNVRGWALDPDTVDPIRVHIYVDGSGAAADWADREKPGLSTHFPGLGDLHAYDRTLTGLSAGDHRVCVYALDQVDPGQTVLIGCRTATVP
ncbi:hypothetical protein [Agromyces sp. SYSU T00194]|uniref:hypothetical protein n=1 Tax=Agromyces chitinivorans TaxID=3158560 RepID=UPI003391747F